MSRFGFNQTEFSVNNTKWMIEPIEPIAHVTTKQEKEMLKKYDYMVGPKADGERMLLLCDDITMDLYLLCSKSPPFKLDGKYQGYCRGFLLDVEVIQLGDSTRLILPFDVVATGSKMNWKGNEVQVGKRSFWDRLQWRSRSLLQRYWTLQLLVTDITQPGLLVKPIAPANYCRHMKSLWEDLPFKTDGLIFTPLRASPTRSTLKWKPLSEITLDVAVGGPLEQGDTHSSFRMHVHSVEEYPPDPYPLPKAAPEAVPPNHKPLEILNLKNRFEFITAAEADPEPYDDDDIVLTHNEDLMAIMEEREQEGVGWDPTTKKCNRGNCPCGETLPRATTDTGFQHCCLCGALGVAEGGLAFTCAAGCAYAACLLENIIEAKQPVDCMVKIPNEEIEKAKHAIVEVTVAFSGGSPIFTFKRIRPDKTLANTLQAANDILLHRNVSLDDLDIKSASDEVWQGLKPKDLPYECGRKRSEESVGFANLRSLHHQAKGWLYRAFGGKTVIDLCSGGLRDIPNWVKAHFLSVVAVEKDPEECRRGRAALAEHSSSGNLSVELVEADLSTPIDLSHDTLLATQEADAIFCNFAIHYLWDRDEKTKTFLENTIPHLRAGGRFVVTFMQGDLVARTQEVRISDELGNVAFEAQVLDDDKHIANVYVASIGKPHVEAIVYLEDLKKVFRSAGLQFIALYPFQTLCNLFPETSLSVQEGDMSSLYAAAVFEKSAKSHEQGTASPPFLFNPDWDALLERAILKYLSVPDLVRCRLLSGAWKEAIDGLAIPKTTKFAYFGKIGSDQKKAVEYDSITESYCLRNRDYRLNARSLAQYFRFGGSQVVSRERVVHHNYRLYDYNYRLYDYGSDPGGYDYW